MDPFPGTGTYPFHLPKLTIIEEMLIAKAHVIMSVYRLKKSGTVVYRGNVLNVQQDNDGLLKSILNPNDSLPRKISDFAYSLFADLDFLAKSKYMYPQQDHFDK